MSYSHCFILLICVFNYFFDTKCYCKRPCPIKQPKKVLIAQAFCLVLFCFIFCISAIPD